MEKQNECRTCPYYRRYKVIRKYLPSIVHEALTSAINSGIIEEEIAQILKRIDNDSRD